MTETVMIPYPDGATRASIRPAAQLRSTWVSTSIQTLRAHGLYDAYLAHLPEKDHVEIQSLVAGVWMPMEFSLAHYAACDALALPEADILAIGRESSRRAHSTLFAMMVRVARGAGVTPWTSLAHVQKLWARSLSDGGGVAIYQLGPKEARFEMAGFPPARFRYVRVAVRGIAHTVIELFAQSVFVRDVPALCDDNALGYRLSWA